MISIVSGLPGSGKNVYVTYLARKHFRRENNIIARIIRSINHEPTIVNNIYTSYPVLLNKKKKIYSNLVTLTDLDGRYRFLKHSLIIIDEVQSIFDSDEHKEFPKNIATFNQFHRHFDIDDIIYISQHPSRIVKKLRNVSCVFMKIRKFFVIPILKVGIMYYTNYYEFDDYGKWHHPTKEQKTYDVDNHFRVFSARKVFSSYNSKYLSVLNKDKPLYSKGSYTDLNLSPIEIKEIYGDMFEVDKSTIKRKK